MYRVIAGTVDTIAKIARGLKVKAPATIVVGEVVSVLHGPQQGLISDAAEGMFVGVDKDKVARAAKRVAEAGVKAIGEPATGVDAAAPAPTAGA